MSRLRRCLDRTFVSYLYRRIKEWHFKTVTLPASTDAVLHSVKLDISKLELGMKDVILKSKYEQYEVTVCRKLFKPGERILELGGAIGFIGLFCLENLKAAKVVSVEPNPGTIGILRRNYELNGRVADVIQAAVAAEDGSVRLNVSSSFWTDSILIQSGQASGNVIEVPALSLQSILSKCGDQFTALILDVEGAEQWLDWKTLPGSIEKIVIEIHPDILGFAKAYGVLQSIMNRGFEVSTMGGQVFGLVRSGKGDR